MKKIVSFIILLVFLVTLSACGGPKHQRYENPQRDFLSGVERTYYIGHRGSTRSMACENTYEAFCGGVDAGYDGLETDIHISKDGVFFCFHDDTLKRLTKYEDVKSSINVSSVNFNEIENIKISQMVSFFKKKGPNKICTFDRYLEVCKKYNMIPIIELKPTTGMNFTDTYNIPPLLAKIKKYNLQDCAIVMTKMKNCLKFIRSIDKEIHLQWLCSDDVNSFLEEAMKLNISIDIQYNECTYELVQEVHKYNLIVNIWTLNNSFLLRKYLDMGVDFITTDKL